MLRWKSSLKPVAAAAPNDNFEFTVTTTTASETFTILCNNLGTFNAIIDWGDGTSTSTITAYNDADLAHTYATAGDHDISISGTFPNMQFAGSGDVTKIKSVNNMGSVGMTSTYGMLWGATNLTSFTVGDGDTSLVVRSHHMFCGCTSLTSLDLSTLDLSNSALLDNFLRDCTSLTSVDFSSFDTSSATAMTRMFSGCTSLTSLDISSFDTSSVQVMAHMFNGCTSLTSLDVSHFNTSNVTTMLAMFNGLSFTSLDLSSFDTSSVRNFNTMFNGMGGGTDQLTITGIEDFDITAALANRMNNFMANTGGLSTTVYDELLVNWEAQTGYNAQNPNFGGSKYTASSAAATARAALITAGWSITDGGTA